MKNKTTTKQRKVKAKTTVFYNYGMRMLLRQQKIMANSKACFNKCSS